MSTIFNGKIEHGMIRPDVPLDLPDGETVWIKILPVDLTLSQKKYIENVEKVAGCLADLPQEDWNALDEIVATRKKSIRRGVAYPFPLENR